MALVQGRNTVMWYWPRVGIQSCGIGPNKEYSHVVLVQQQTVVLNIHGQKKRKNKQQQQKSVQQFFVITI